MIHSRAYSIAHAITRKHVLKVVSCVPFFFPFFSIWKMNWLRYTHEFLLLI